MPHDDKRNATANVLGPRDAPKGEVIGRGLPRHGIQKFLKFLKAIDRATPKLLDIRGIAANAAILIAAFSNARENAPAIPAARARQRQSKTLRLNNVRERPHRQTQSRQSGFADAAIEARNSPVQMGDRW
ncbi:MAG: hypothetical protein ACREC9_04910 [Methylocella sp.]